MGSWAAGFAVAVLAAGCTSAGDGGSSASEQAAVPVQPVAEATLSVSEAVTVAPDGAYNPTTAVDPASGMIYLAWAQDVAGGEAPEDGGEDGEHPAPLREAVVARSDDDGATFADPVVVSAPGDTVVSFAVSPTQVALGPEGEVYLLYLTHTDYPTWEGYEKRGFLNLARSDDGGETFAAPVWVADEATEGVETAMEMANLFVAPDGDVYVTFLDFREVLDDLRAAADAPAEEEHAGHGAEEEGAPTQLRLARSTDGGQTFAASSLVSSEATCECCGTGAAQGSEGPVFATTRSSWALFEGSYEPVRDVFVSASGDDDATWGDPVRVHADNFKISGCPDINSGLAVDSQGRLHTACTGTETGPGVYYAVSDDDGATFSEPVALLTDEWIPYGDVRLTLDGDDNAWVVFEDRREEAELVQVAKVDGQGAAEWSEAWPGRNPSVAVAGDEAVVTWMTVGDQPDEHGEETFGVQVLLVSS